MSNLTTTLPLDIPVSVLLTKSPRAKHLRITIRPNKTITLTIPKHSTRRQAQQFLNSKIPWIKKQLQKIEKLQQNYPQENLPPIDRTKAKTILTNRLNHLARKHGFSYNRVFIRNQKTLWGSCSSKNNINLNINLVRLPQELQDYVILHELVHLKIRNHSKEFWGELGRYVGGRAKVLQKELRGCKMGVGYKCHE